MTRAERHAAFVKLHDRSKLLILPNAWDAASARIIAHAGASAIATTSSGVANALGYADGNHLPTDMAVGLVARVVAAVDVPVTADIEEGFGDTPDAVANTVAAVAEAGAVGINIEDAMRPAELMAAKIEAIKARLSATGTPLFINARIDSYLRGHDAPFEEALRRAALYRKAGADGIFIPFIAKPAEIRAACAAIDAPVNVLLKAGLPSPAELFELGVARLTAGGALFYAVQGFAHRAATDFLNGDYQPLFDNRLPPEISKTLFS